MQKRFVGQNKALAMLSRLEKQERLPAFQANLDSTVNYLSYIALRRRK